MISYGIYNIVVKDNENLKDRFKEIFSKEIDNFEYKTVKETYSRLPDTSMDGKINTIIYEKNTILNFPNRYRLINKKEIFSDFPDCNTFK